MPGVDASAIHGRLGARVALLQSPILPAAVQDTSRENIFEAFPLTNHIPVIRGQQVPTPAPRYALRKDLGFWQLPFEGNQAILKHEQGPYYAAFPLPPPPQEPVHGLV